MLLPRTRYLWFMVVSVIYLLMIFVLHRRLHRFSDPELSYDDADVEAAGRRIIDDNATNVDEWPSLAFPVVHPCIGPSLAPSSRLLPLGSDWFYTAYFDDRLTSVYNDTYIRVLALLRRRLDFNLQKPTFYFRWPQSETGNTKTALAEMYEMCENHGRRYGGWILSTRFTGTLPPCSITVTQNLSRAAEVQLPVFRMSADETSTVDEENNFWMVGMSLLLGLVGNKVTNTEANKLREKFAVCVPPLYGAITPTTLVQFVELTRLLGAEHIVFYISGVSESVRRVLDAYQADDVVTTIPWILPAVVAQSVWYNGQLLAANDCLYRTSHAFQYVAFNDVDEFIVPHSAADWSLMLAELATSVELRKQLEERDGEQADQRGSDVVCYRQTNFVISLFEA